MKEIFANHHRQQQDRADDDGQHWNEKMRDLEHQLDVMNEQIQANRPTKGVRWVDPGLLPPLHPGQTNPKLTLTDKEVRRRGPHRHEFFDVPRRSEGGVMAWETEYVARKKEVRQNHVDYTRRPYRYPELTMVPPANGEYPKLRPLQDLLREWPQDELDSPPDTIHETLMHFDYNIPEHMVAAKAYRDAKLPFKLINVPEVVAAGQKWTDDYVSTNFDGGYETSNGPPAHGTCQESVDNFFAFFVPTQWSVRKWAFHPPETMTGPLPNGPSMLIMQTMWACLPVNRTFTGKLVWTWKKGRKIPKNGALSVEIFHPSAAPRKHSLCLSQKSKREFSADLGKEESLQPHIMTVVET
jgi:hypothetical protein